MRHIGDRIEDGYHRPRLPVGTSSCVLHPDASLDVPINLGLLLARNRVAAGKDLLKLGGLDPRVSRTCNRSSRSGAGEANAGTESAAEASAPLGWRSLG